MATYNVGIDLPFVANADLTAKQYYFVTASGTGGDNPGVNIATGASNPAPTGVLQNEPKNGEEANVRVWGVSKLWCDGDTGAIVYGDYLTADGGGAGTINSNGSSVGAMAMEALASGSAFIKVLLLPYASGNKSDNTP